MNSADNILRLLTSSTNKKFDGALEILDIITQLVADRLGAEVCATFYRRNGENAYRLLSIEDSLGVENEFLPSLEDLVNSHADQDGFNGCYLDLSSLRPSGSAYLAPLLKAGVAYLYCHSFETSGGDRALILALICDTERTGVVSANKVCQLAARQMDVVFNFVALELRDRAVSHLLDAVLRLTAIKFEDLDFNGARERIGKLAEELSGVLEATLILSGDNNYEGILSEFLTLSQAGQGQESRPSMGTTLKVVVKSNSEVMIALDLDTRPFGFVRFMSADETGFGEDAIESLSMFCSYVAVTLSNFNLALRQKRINDDLRRAQDRLVKSESMAALGDMASGLAHDFNNMLGAIVGRLELLKISTDDSKLIEKLDVIEGLAKEGGERIRRLQEYAISVKPVNLQPLDLLALFERYSAEGHVWSGAAESKKIQVQFHSNPDSKAIIEGQAEDICILLDSIISNAVEATSPGGDVTVQVEVTDEQAKIKVHDSGPGIPVSIKNKIFNPFFSTKREKGAGLGLSLAHGIALRHGGAISAQSQESMGATFTTIFPLVKSPVKQSEEPTEEETTIQMRVMVVDDDAQIREVLGDMLAMLDQEVEVFPDGQTALAAFPNGQFDLVITDLGMPGMSGLEFVREIRKIDSEIPIALVTGWGAQLDKADVIAKGVKTVLAKPFYLSEIKELLATSLQSSRSA